MNLNHFHILTAAILCVYTFPLEHGSAAEPTAREVDVVIYGGTPAGVMAAVQVQLMGKSCVLIEPGHHLGGLSSSGLGRTDADDTRVIGGLAREFYKRLKQHYDRDESWIYEDRQRYKAYKADADGMFYFEPHVAEKLFDQFAKESGAMVVRGERLDLKSGVVMQGRRITAFVLKGKTLGRHVHRCQLRRRSASRCRRQIHHRSGGEFSLQRDPQRSAGSPCPPPPTWRRYRSLGISRATRTAVCCPESGPNPVPTAAETSVSRLTTSACA